MDILKALTTRRSVRRYKQSRVPRETLLELAEMCRFAPSGGNRQQWELVLVDDSQLAEQVFDTLAWLPAVGPPPPGKKPPAYMVVISDEKSDALADCAAVTTYLLLAAWGKGLGSCWFGSIRRTELADLLDIPDEYSVEFVVSLGYPAEQLKTVDDDRDTEVKAEGEVTEVPKRAVDKMLHLNQYGNRGERNEK